MPGQGSNGGTGGALSPPRAAAAAMVGAGVLAAIVLPGNPIGVGAFLVAIAVTGSVALGRPRPIDRVAVALSALGIALSATAFLRAAEWVVAAAAAAALGLACIVVVGGSMWADVVRAPLMVAARLPRAVPFIARGAIGPGVGDRWLRTSPLVRGVALGAGLLIVFGGLFASADRAFAHLVEEYLVPDLSLLPIRLVVFGAVTVGAAALAASGRRYAALGTPWAVRVDLVRAAGGEDAGARRLRPVEWTVGLAALDLLFASFVALQITVLFGGHRHVLETAGLSYAEYARAGFFQLLAAAALTLVVVGVVSRVAERSGARETNRLRILVGLLCVFTLIVLLSAMRRLQLYEEAFGFTRSRVAAHAVMLWLAGLFLLVIVAGVAMRGRWIPLGAVAWSALALVAFAIVGPDGLVARSNVERFRESGMIDLSYLKALSPDAVPALAALPPRLRGCALEGLAAELARPDPPIAWNLARSRARAALAAVAPLPACRPARVPDGVELAPG